MEGPRTNHRGKHSTTARRQKSAPPPHPSQAAELLSATGTLPAGSSRRRSGQAAQLSSLAVEREASHEEIGRRAYELYERRGRAPGRDLDDWFDAERELREQRQRR